MQRESVWNSVIAALLGVVLSISAVGCLISGFGLEIQQVPLLTMVSVLFSVIGAIAFSYRFGWAAVLGVLGMASLFFWQGGEAQTQTQALITRISYVYDQAYQCGVIRFPGAWYGVKADLPMLILSCLIALSVTWVVCRRRAAIWALVAVFLPFVPCLVVVDTVPSGGCVFFWLIGVLILLLTSSARRRDPERSHALTGMAAVASFAAVAVLFVTVPQSAYRNPHEHFQNQLLEALGFEGYGSGGSGGEIEGVDLQGLGSRFFLQYPVMSVTSPKDGVLYLRERDFNRYNGYSWESDEERADKITNVIAATLDTQTVSVETEWFRAQLLMPYYVSQLEPLTDGVVKNTEKTLTYSWPVWELPDDWKEQIPNVAPAPEEQVLITPTVDPKYYHSLPAETQAWAQELLSRILTDERSATAIADTVAAYVKNSAVYEDDCKRMPTSEHDFAKWFIESGESGYCVHFATATAVLLRAAGVNTRYVTGYMVQAVAGEKVTVTADLEHAWTEYYEPALDMWIPLESTPAEIERPDEPETTTAPTTTTTSADTENTTRPTQPTQPQAGGINIPWAAIFAVLWKVLLVAAIVAAVITAVRVQRMLRQRRWQQRFDQSDPNRQALMLWHQIERMGRRLGTQPTDALYALAQKAKFSQHTLSESELQAFTDERDELIGMLRTRSWFMQFVYRYVLLLYK